MLRKNLILALLVLIAATPAVAYTIYLKDGSRLIAREKYQLEGDRALIMLQNGTQTFLDAGEIDVQRTEAANRNAYGTAMVLEDGKFTDSPRTAPAPREDTLGDLAGRREVGPPTRPQARRQPQGGHQTGPLTDLYSAQRQPFRDLDLAAEIQQVFMAQGVAGAQILQGTSTDRVLLEVTADSEASVFRGLKVAADALVHVRTRTAAPISAFEIVLVTSARERAGQFLIDPALASALAAGEIELSTFYVQNVQF